MWKTYCSKRWMSTPGQLQNAWDKFWVSINCLKKLRGECLFILHSTLSPHIQVPIWSKCHILYTAKRMDDQKILLWSFQGLPSKMTVREGDKMYSSGLLSVTTMPKYARFTVGHKRKGVPLPWEERLTQTNIGKDIGSGKLFSESLITKNRS